MGRTKKLPSGSDQPLAVNENGDAPIRRSRGRPSMADVAQLADVSQSTVSIILNRTPGVRIAQATRERVLKSVKELDYKIPERRHALPPGGAPIALVVDRLATSIEAIWSIEGAREALWPSGQLLNVMQTLDDPEMEKRTLDYLLRQRSEGIIYATNHTRRVTPPRALYEADCPVVLLNCYSDDFAFPAIMPGEVAAGMRATNHLLSAGHERIAIITGELWMEAAGDRLTGYRRALATADIAFDPDLVREGNWQVNSGYQRTLELLALPRPPTAIFCCADRTAVGCLQALNERGLHVPDDMSIVGFDNEEISQHVVPALTTLELPQKEMGRWAVDWIRSEGSKTKSRQTITKLECQLIERNSVSGPRKA